MFNMYNSLSCLPRLKQNVVHCSKRPKGRDDEHTIYETNRAMGNDNSILCAERSKKRGQKRKKTQKALEVSVSCSMKSGKGFLTLWQTHFFTGDKYS